MKDSEPELLRTSAVYPTSTVLVNNSRVYAVADYYQIPNLKTLAAAKFSGAGAIWFEEGFVEVIEEVYHSTPSTDKTLRRLTCQLAIEHSRKLLNNAIFMTALSQQGEFAKDFVHMLALKHDEELSAQAILASEMQDRLEIEEEKSQTEIESLATNLATEKARATKIMINMYSIRDDVNSADTCRHCRVSCNAKLENIGTRDQPQLRLRCSGCNTKY